MNIQILTRLMIYLGCALMVFNIARYAGFIKKMRWIDKAPRIHRALYLPLTLLIAFLAGYLGVAFFGRPDILVASILLGGSICQGMQGEYLLESGNRFYELDFDAGSTTELMQWSYAQLSPCQHALRLAEQSFLVQQQGSDSLLAVRLCAQPRRERSTVRVAVYNSRGAADLVREQDNLSELYHYEITEYAGDELDKLLVTMGTPDCPDLLLFCNDLTYGAISTASAAFADLYPFLDADGELSRDSFLPNLLNYLEVGGELREIQ